MTRIPKFASWIVLSLLVLSIPAAAAVYDAQNANKVDGKHAVSSGASKKSRAGKLVATNSKGLLPNNIIAKAPNAVKLGGKKAGFFAPKTHTHNGVPYANVIIVAKSGGDFASVQAALDSVAPTSSDPVLIYIAPGEYDGHINMDPYADLQGAGRNLTTLTLSAAGSTEVLDAAEHSSISDLSIVNSRSGSSNTAVRAAHDAGSSIFDNVVARAETGADNAVGFDASGSNTRLVVRNAFVEGRVGGDGQALGFRLSAGGQLDLLDSEVQANGFGNGNIRGINNLGGLATINDSSVLTVGPPTGTGGTVAVATGSGASGADTRIRDSLISSGATNGNDRVLLINGAGSHLEVAGSTLRNPDDEAVLQSTPVTSGPFIRISYSELDGGANQFDIPSPLLFVCLYTHDGFVELDSLCQ